MRMPNDPGAASASAAATLALVEQLSTAFREQVSRAIGCELDWTATSLAFVDHYLGLAGEEDREPILALLGAGAGAYFGEVVRREVGGTWAGDGKDPRRLRLLLSPNFVHFSPVDLALEMILSGASAPDVDAAGLDTAFRLSRAAAPDLDEDALRDYVDDAEWMDRRLAELPPVPADQYYSLTGRYETLKLILEMLAVKHASERREPRTYALADYVAELVGEG